ncbi:MAG: ribonuclease P protein component [bacterium]
MLPRDERIASGAQIKAIIRKKQFQFSTPLLYIVAARNNQRLSRLVVVCKKALGNAVKRNKTRRRIVSAYKDIKHNMTKNIDIVIFPKEAEKEKAEYQKSLKCLNIS